jgi:plastocyanin domain-containing protein
MIIFPASGLYRVWAQFQVDGRLITMPFDLTVGPPVAKGKRSTPNQLDPAITRVQVSSRGFSPTEVVVPSGQPWRIAIERTSEPNCASQIVIPALGIRKKLPLGETTILDLPPLRDGRISFSCGMGMYRGMLLISPAPRAKKEDSLPR